MKVVLNVALERFKERINRQVLASQETLLTDLCEYVIVSMNGHKLPLYRLEIGDVLYYAEDMKEEKNEKSLLGLKLKDLSLKKGDTFKIAYDFDHYYFFHVSVDAFLEDDRDIDFQVLSGKGFGLNEEKGGKLYLDYLLDSHRRWDDYTKREKEFIQKKFDVLEVNNWIDEYKRKKEIQKLPRHYVFNISLEGFNKEIKRKISVNSNILIEDFCKVIVASMNGDLSHMFGVKVGKEFLNEWFFFLELFYLNLEEKQKLKIIYDFGDNWVFNLTLSKIEDGYMDVPYKVLAGKGYGIIDDCGGVRGLENIFSGKDKSWGKYDINYFNLDKCNKNCKKGMKTEMNNYC